MAEHQKIHIKSLHALSRFDPKARKEVADRELNALGKLKNAAFYFLKGENHRIVGELKQAISHYERALQIDPEHQDSLFFRGYCYLPKAEQGRDDDLELDKTARVKEAVSTFQKLICRLNQNTATQRLTTSICPARSMIQMLTMQRH